MFLLGVIDPIWTGIGVLVVVLAALVVAPKAYAAWKNNHPNAGVTTGSAVAAVGVAVPDPLVALFKKVKADVEMSAPSRMTMCALISVVESVSENLPNLAERAEARKECKSLGSKFLVTPTPADDTTVQDQVTGPSATPTLKI